jgi:hypothetical protein
MEADVYKKLSKDEKELLATLYETQSMRAMIVAGDFYQRIKAEWVVTNSPDYNNVLFNRGAIEGARFIVDLCKYCLEKQKKV